MKGRKVAGSEGSITSELLPTDVSSDIVRRYATVMARYHPKPLAVPAIFYSADYDGRGWCRLIPDLEIVRLPPGHIQSVTDHVGDLANHLRGKLVELSDAAAG